mgnify:CR=1 FL=1
MQFIENKENVESNNTQEMKSKSGFMSKRHILSKNNAGL